MNNKIPTVPCDNEENLDEPQVLSELYDLCKQQREQKAIEVVLLRLEHGVRSARRQFVDNVLARAEVARLTPAVLLAALSITFPAKDFLEARNAFLARAEASIEEALGHDRAAALLASRR